MSGLEASPVSQNKVYTCQCVHAGADLKERALMNDAESDLFVHGLRSLMTQIGRRTISQQILE